MSRGWPGERGRGEVVAIAGPALVFVTGLVCVVAWSIDPSGAIPAGLRWVAGAAAVGVGGVLLLARRGSRLAAHVIAAVAATGLVTLAVVATGAAGDRASVLTVPIAVYAGYVLPRPLALGVLATIGVGLGTALLLSDIPAPLLAWSLTMATAGSAAYAVRLLRLRVRRLLAQLGDDARRDHLTGVLNRRGVDERLDEEIRRARRTSERLSVLIGDLDGFKAINDRHGHAEGDRALQAVAAALVSGTRDTDVVGRLGGDEFIVVLTATDASGARESEERIGAALSASLHDLPDRLTVSFGASTFPDDAEGAEALVAAADERLLSAKRSARTDGFAL